MSRARDEVARANARLLAPLLVHYGANGAMTYTELTDLRNQLENMRREVSDEIHTMPPEPSPLGVQIARDFFASQMFAQAVAKRGAA